MAPAVEKRGKKRSAPSQAGPKAKKVQVEKASATKVSEKGKKRSRPITLPAVVDSADSSDEGEELEVEEDIALEEGGEPSTKGPDAKSTCPLERAALLHN